MFNVTAPPIYLRFAADMYDNKEAIDSLRFMQKPGQKTARGLGGISYLARARRRGAFGRLTWSITGIVR